MEAGAKGICIGLSSSMGYGAALPRLRLGKWSGCVTRILVCQHDSNKHGYNSATLFARLFLPLQLLLLLFPAAAAAAA